MSQERRLLELLEAAVEVEAGEHRRVLEAMTSDPALIEEALAALAGEEKLGGFLDRPAAENFAGADLEETLDESGRAGGGETSAGTHAQHPVGIGPYQILDVLGEGGMGVVYLAEQRQPIERRVALKVIRSGRGVRHELRQRFEVDAPSVVVVRRVRRLALPPGRSRNARIVLPGTGG